MNRRILIILLMVFCGLLLNISEAQAAVPVVQAGYSTDTTAGTTDTTVSLTKPTGLVAGDLILVLFVDEQINVNDCPAITSPDAYTQITKHADNAEDVQASIYWRIATGLETWPLVISGATGDYAVGWCLRISGAHQTTPIHQTGAWVGVGLTGTGATLTEVTTTVADCLGIFLIGLDGADIAPTTITTGVGWSITNSLEDPADAASGAAADWGQKNISSAGGSADIVLDFAGTGIDGYVGIQIAIAPAPPSLPVTVTSITDTYTNSITTYDGTGYLRDADATVNMTLLTTPSAAPVLWFDVGAAPTNALPSRSVTSDWVSGTTCSAVIPASDSEITDGALVQFLVNVDGTNRYLTGTTPWKYTVDEAAPTNVGCSTPANNAEVSSSTSLVALTATDSGAGLHSTPYYIQLATDTGFTTGLQNSTWDADGSWSPTLVVGTTYYWRVKAKDALGKESAQCGHTPDNAGYGTFTVISSDASVLKISEVCVGTTGSTIEFIEIYNPTSTSVYISDTNFKMKLLQGSAATTLTTKGVTWNENIVPAHGFFLFGIPVTTFSPTPDAGWAAATLTGDSGVVITDASDVVIDKVGWGNITAEGITLAVETTKISNSLATGDSIERNATSTSNATTLVSGGTDETKGNSKDANVNSTDFVFHSASYVPQNSSSTREDPVTKLLYQTAAQELAVNAVSGPYSVWSVDENSYSCPLYAGAATINLSSDSLSELFDTSAGGAFDGTITSITIASGVYEGVFYYKEPTTGGIYTVTSAEVSPGTYSRYWTDATQAVTITGGANTAPTISINSATQAADGTGNVTISVEAYDANQDNCKIKVYWGTDTSCPNKCTMTGTATADITPVPDVTTANAYQVGTTTPVLTTGPAYNTVTFKWDSLTDLPAGDGTYYIKTTINDGTEDCTTPPTTSLTIDNVAPVISVATNITTDPITAGSTTIALASTWTETNDSGGSTASSFDAAINGGAYIGEQAGTASKTATIAAYALGATLDGDDYISKIQSKLTDYYGNVSNWSEVISNTYVKPYTPQAPTVTNTTASNTLYVNVNPHASEVATVKYAIYCSATSPTDSNWLDKYVAADGSASASAVWQADATWGTVTVTGLLENTQYTFKVQATNPNNEGTTVSDWSTTASKYPLLDPPTDGELTVSPHATNPTIMDPISVATPPNSTAGTTSALFTVMTGSASGAGNHGWNGYSYSDTGLIANTQYGWKVKYRNGNSTATTETNEKTAYTLAKAPSESASTTTIQQVTCDRSKSTWYNAANGPTFTFSTADGFGVGKVQYFKYVWDTNVSTDPSGGTNWTTGTLPLDATSDSNSWYLHLKSYNADNVGNPALLHFGPFCYDGTDPTSVTISNVTESADNLHYKENIFYYSNDQSMTDAFIVTVTASDATSDLQKCVGENGFGETAPTDSTYDGGYEITYTVNQTESETSPLTMTVYDNANNTATVDLTIALDNTAPAQISGLSAPSSTASSVSLSWTALGSAGPSGFSTYEIWYSTNATVDTSDNLWDETDEAALSLYTTSSATVTGLSASTTYYFNIDGLDNVKNRGALGASEVEKATTSGATKDIKINEIFAWGGLGVTASEGVELYNSGTTAHNLNGWQLRDSSAVLANISVDLTMNPGDYVMIYSADGPANDTDMSDGFGSITSSDWTSAGDLVNTGDAIFIYDTQTEVNQDSTTICDYIYYDESDAGDGLIDDDAVTAGIWTNAAAIDTYTGSTMVGRSIYLYQDGYTPNENVGGNAEDNDWHGTPADADPETSGAPNRPPTAVTAVKFKTSGFSADATSANIGDSLYLQVTGTDAEASYSNTCVVKLTSAKETTGVRVTLTETADPGTYRSDAVTLIPKVESSTSYAADTVGANASDTLRLTYWDDDKTNPVSPYHDLTVGGVTISITNWRELY